MTLKRGKNFLNKALLGFNEIQSESADRVYKFTRRNKVALIFLKKYYNTILWKH
jgi:hypothetical protein